MITNAARVPREADAAPNSARLKKKLKTASF
jgi:hypothetical protein